MDRFFAGRSTAKPRAPEPRSESLSSWTDVAESFADAWQLTDEGHHTAMSIDRNGHDSYQSRQSQLTNGLNSLPPDTGGGAGPSSIVQPPTDDRENRLSRSLDLGHDSFQRLNSEPGVTTTDSLSTSSMDYLWDANDVPDTRKFNSLPHGGVYSTTSNGSLPGSPMTARRQGEAPDQTDKIKTKLMAAWNNMRHGWTVRRKTSFKYDDPIWMLGNYYHDTSQEREELRARQQHGMQVISSMERFKRDFSSRLWFTYRQNFLPLPNSQYTTDVGWGCMIRTGQMMLAHALLMHFLGREWRWYPQQRPQEVIYHHQIIRLFGDAPSDDCPFSLHKLAQIGQRSGKNPGDWYGPASVAHVLSEAVMQAPNNPLASQICVYVAQDCTVYKQDVLDLCAMMGSRRGSYRARHTSSTSEDARPGTPGNHPGTPSNHPGTPGNHPGTPGNHPGTPGNHPGTPGTHPGTPGNHPGTPGNHPGTPGNHPGTPGNHPGTPGNHPGTPGNHPGTPGNHPGTTGGARPPCAAGGERTPCVEEPWKALVVLIPVRLGGECLNEAYIPCIQTMLTHRMCLGVIGGKPKHSVYFVGWQADKLVYLDPHFCQDTVDISDRHFPVHSYHCMSPRKLPSNKMDPSCTLGFFCKTRVDFETFIREASQMTAPPMDTGHYPMFTVSDGRSCDVVYPQPSEKPRHKVSNDRLSARMRVSSKESDDFVFL